MILLLRTSYFVHYYILVFRHVKIYSSSWLYQSFYWCHINDLRSIKTSLRLCKTVVEIKVLLRYISISRISELSKNNDINKFRRHAMWFAYIKKCVKIAVPVLLLLDMNNWFYAKVVKMEVWKCKHSEMLASVSLKFSQIIVINFTEQNIL